MGRSVPAVLAAGLVLAGCAGEADGEGAARPSTSAVPVDQTVEVRMVDVAFRPEAIEVRAGTTVRFVFVNDGRLPHEAAFGDEATQQAVASGRRELEGVEAMGPGKVEDYVRTFTTPGELLIGCHVPGHYRAGMKARITVR